MSAQRNKWIATGTGLALLVLCATPISAQDSGNSELLAQLKKEYKIAKLGADSSGLSVVEPGTVLVIQKGGILGVPPANLTIGQATYKDGELHGPPAGQVMFLGTQTKQLTKDEKVYIVKMDLNAKKDRVTLLIMECDSCNGVQQPSSYKAQVIFQFPKDYLAAADAGQLKDVISQVLSPESSSNDQQGQAQQQPQQQQAPAQQPPARAAAPPPATTQTIQMGQTPEQVEAALGQPEKKVNLGAKQIYVYKDLKITFVNGKVSDVQ